MFKIIKFKIIIYGDVLLKLGIIKLDEYLIIKKNIYLHNFNIQICMNKLKIVKKTTLYNVS